MVKTAPCSVGDTGSVPGGGSKIPHATEKRSLCATTRELVHRKEKSCVMQQRSFGLQLRSRKAKYNK